MSNTSAIIEEFDKIKRAAYMGTDGVESSLNQLLKNRQIVARKILSTHDADKELFNIYELYNFQIKQLLAI